MRDKPNIILIEELASAQPRLDKIIGLFANVNGYGHNGEQKHTEQKSDQELPQYVPVDRPHASKIAEKKWRTC
jgi:hypothetical protein